MPMDIESTLFYSTESSLENKIRKSLNDTYGTERPSKKSLSTILSFAASYECLNTKIGRIDLMFN